MGLYFVLPILGGRRTAFSVFRVGDGELAARNSRVASRHALAHTVFFAVALLVTTFLTLPYSQPIWERVPLLELAEFPWRWLGPAVLCSAMLAGAVMYIVEDAVTRRWGAKAAD